MAYKRRRATSRKATERRTMKIIMEDTRPIIAIKTHGEDGYLWSVGDPGVTEIKPYLEGTNVWFVVYNDDEIYYRVNASFLDHITYLDAYN